MSTNYSMRVYVDIDFIISSIRQYDMITDWIIQCIDLGYIAYSLVSVL